MIMSPLNQVHPPAHPQRFDVRRVGRFLLYTAIVTFCLAAFASIGVILFGDFGGTEGRILLSSFSIAAFSLAGLIATARFGRQPAFLAPLGLGSAGIGLLLTLTLIWAGPNSDVLARVTVSVIIIAGALAHANLLLADPDDDDPAALILVGTLVLNAILTALIVFPILLDNEPDGGFYWKAVASIAVLLVLGTLVVPIVRKIDDRDIAGAIAPDPSFPIWLPSDNGALDMSYRGRMFRIRAESLGADRSGFTFQAWETNDPRQRPIIVSPELPTAADLHAALGSAVQVIARAIDEDQI